MRAVAHMTSPAALVVAFKGRVHCRRDVSGPLGLTLVGCSADRSETVWLAFHGEAPHDLPAVLESAAVQRLGTQEYSITTEDRRWTVVASRVHMHRDVSPAFYAAVPPRRVPLFKRVLWTVGLAVAASPLGRYWLNRVRGP
jgi:hypothetical protein